MGGPAMILPVAKGIGRQPWYRNVADIRPMPHTWAAEGVSAMAACCNRPDTGRRINWRRLLTNRVMIIGGVILAVAAGLAAGSWGWLVAVGVAPIILTILPCAVTCGLGLCVLGLSSRTKSDVAPAGDTAIQEGAVITRRDDPMPSPAAPVVVGHRDQQSLETHNITCIGTIGDLA
jgi:hypothetical protein